MPLAPALTTLAHYLAGEFDNREQAIAEPAWYVHLRLWHRPVPLFTEDSVTLFAEQANVLHLEQAYRQRLLRLQACQSDQPGLRPGSIQVQYYSFKQPAAVKGAGLNPQILQTLTPDAIERLPGCILYVTQQGLSADSYTFTALPPAEARCCFTYEGEVRQVALGFEARPEEFFSYDKGIDLETGKALWGAIMGPYQFQKRQSFSIEP